MTRSILRVAGLASALLAAASAGAQQHAPAQPTYANEMAREHAHDMAVASPATKIAPRLAIAAGETVTYGTVGGKTLKGYLAKPKSGKAGPAIVMVHEWWGLNDNIKSMADRYAGEGYTVLAVDLFDGKVATKPDDAMKLYQAGMADIPAGEANVAAAVAYLRKNGATSVGSVGYCFGGHWSLRTGLAGGKDVNAVVIYYGAPITDAKQLARLKAPVLGLYGGKDTGIPVDSVKAMNAAITKQGGAMRLTVYDDAAHAFANPTGTAYNEKAANDAWAKSLAFFKAMLK